MKLNNLSSSLNLNQIKQWIQNPYVVGVLGLLMVVYGSFMAPQLPPLIASWFVSPIFKVIFMFVILMVHRFSPAIALILAVVFILSIQTLSKYYAYAFHVKHASPAGTDGYQKPTPAEMAQYGAEFTDDYLLRKNLPTPPEPSNGLETSEGLHPLNRPTNETLYQNQRIENPDDPRQPGLQFVNNPQINTAVYELNPPYAHNSLPIDMNANGDGNLNVAPIDLPPGGPTRYSAFHGYSLTK